MGALDKCPDKASRGRSAGPAAVPPQIDIRKPSAARVYDAILGGKDFRWDRAVAAEVIAAITQAAASAILNRRVLERAVRYLNDQGIDQVLDLGSGLPTARNTHEIARELNLRTVVAYVEITAFFDGLELVNPGVVFLPEWQPDRPVDYPLEIGAQLILGGMAKKP